jgi:photosystem II PsbY protein
MSFTWHQAEGGDNRGLALLLPLIPTLA